MSSVIFLIYIKEDVVACISANETTVCSSEPFKVNFLKHDFITKLWFTTEQQSKKGPTMTCVKAFKQQYKQYASYIYKKQRNEKHL